MRLRIAVRGGTFPLPVECYDRREELSEAELHALLELGPKNLRRNRPWRIPRRTAADWQALARLVVLTADGTETNEVITSYVSSTTPALAFGKTWWSCGTTVYQ